MIAKTSGKVAITARGIGTRGTTLGETEEIKIHGERKVRNAMEGGKGRRTRLTAWRTYLDEYVEATVVGVPAMMNLRLPRGGWHVEQDIEPWRPDEVLRQLSWYHGFVRYDAATTDATSATSSAWSLACHAFYPACENKSQLR